MSNLIYQQLRDLLRSVFSLQSSERWLAIMVDLPDSRIPDNPPWLDRRTIAGEWFRMLHENLDELPFTSVVFCVYPNVGSNNNDLPETAIIADCLPQYSMLPIGRSMSFREILGASSVVLALTEMSATAPLKLMAKEYGFRGATLPGFSREMIPVLAIDYEKVNSRVMEFKERMDRAEGISILLEAQGTRFLSRFDLRFRTGHASGGLMREPGVVGNLPSGEAYIVPYEGEKEGETSRTSGELPVQFDNEIVVYRIEKNNAVEVLTSGPKSLEERQLLLNEPAYGNMAEVGIGVLGEWGVKAVGSTLLDEKLGLHIAFGRSDHFGGVTSPASFRNRNNVVHIDRVYVNSTQPLINVVDVSFEYPQGTHETILTNGAYVV